MSANALTALRHPEVEERDDDALRLEARTYLAQNPPLQLVAEVIAKLRSLELPWWTPAATRELWPSATRMRWLAQRPDLRQLITSKLTGMPPKAARGFRPEQQAPLIDAVVDHGDVPVGEFERAFEPVDLAVYGPAAEFWRAFRERMPWEDSSPVHQRLAAWLIRALTTDRSTFDGIQRKPILTALEVRSAIESSVWQARLPFDLRVEIDQARIKHERTRPREPFTSRHELAIATPERIAESIALSDLESIIVRAEPAMGFASTEATTSTEIGATTSTLAATPKPALDAGALMTGRMVSRVVPPPPARIVYCAEPSA